MGNAVLDILAEAKEEDLTKNNLKKGNNGFSRTRRF